VKKLYLSNFSGLGNRLEALVIAAMIADRWGHSIFSTGRKRTACALPAPAAAASCPGSGSAA
jgi:hypothetical protein